MKSNVIDLTPRIKVSLYDYLAGVGFRRKRGTFTLREKLERKNLLKNRAKAKVLPFPKAKLMIDRDLSLEVVP